MKAFHVALVARNWRTMRHLAVALVAGALAVGAAAQTDDHGDDRASATRVELPSETAGEIDPGDDADWFRFEVAASGEVIAETTGGLDTVGTLYDADGNELAANDDSETRNFQIEHTLDAGTYYVRVTSYGSGTGSYILHLRRGSVVPPVPKVIYMTFFTNPASGDTFELAENIGVQVTFDRTVAVNGRLQLALTIGSTVRQATASFPLENRHILFNYVVQPSDRDADGISIGADALTLEGGTIRDVGGTTDAALDLGGHAISNSAGHKVDGSRESPPVVTDVQISPNPSNGDAHELGEAIYVRVYFDRVVDATAQVRLALTVGVSVRQASLFFGEAKRFLTFRYVVQSSDRDADGIGIGAGALALNGGTIRIHRGNANASLSLGSHAISNSANHKVDGSRETAPAVRWIYLSRPIQGRGDTFEVGDVIWANVAFDRDVEVTGEPQLEIQIGSATRQARFFLNVRNRVLFQYVVRPSDIDEDGISVRASALKLNGGTIRTRGGTANTTLDLHAIANSSNRKVDGSRETTAPTVTSVGIVSAPAGGAYSAWGEIVVRVFFDRAVDVSGAPQLALTIGTATRQASHVEYLEHGAVARYADALYFRYVVQPSDHDPDGISIGADALSLNGGTITTQGGTTNAELEIGAAAIDNAWIHKVNADTADADDHGDDLSSATRVALPSETAGAVDSADDADWFRFEVSARREVTVETSGGLDAVGTLYDLGGNVLALDDDSGGGLNFRIRRTLDAGRYFVQVEAFDNDAIGNYVLRLQSDAGSGDATAAGSATAPHLRNLGDFNGDGRDDVLLRHADGRWHYYPMDGATVLAGGGAANLTRDLAWRTAGIGDFDSDGKDDVLLRNTDGRWYLYPMDGRTARGVGRGTASLTANLAWQVAGVGDFDGDGKDDVLLRHEEGRWHYYRMNGRRPLSGSGRASLTPDLAWQVAGIGDFDGDGKDDVLLRHSDGRWYFYPMNGRTSLAGRGTILHLTANLAWQVAAIGDFDGDGRDDILLRREDGRWRYYPLNGRAERSGSGGVFDLPSDTAISVVGIGDMNGDGRADVLTRGANGGWHHYYPMNGRAVISGSGEVRLARSVGDLAAWSMPWAQVAATGGALRITIAARSPVQPLQAVPITVAGAAGAERRILVDLSGNRRFAADDTIEVAPVTTAAGQFLFAAPLPETLSAGNAARRFAVRIRERTETDETLSNALTLTLGETVVPAEFAGYPTVILDVVLKAVYEGLDDPLLTVEAGAIDPGRSVRTARALGLSTAYSDAQAAALLRSLFGISLVAPGSAATGPLGRRGEPSSQGWGYRPLAARCEALATDALCNAYRRLLDCVGDAIDDIRSGRTGEDHLARCGEIVKDDVVDAWNDYGERIRATGNFLRRSAPRLGHALGVGRPPAQRIFDGNAAMRQVVGVNKTLRTAQQTTEDARETFGAMRDSLKALTEDNPALIAEAQREAAADGVDEAEREALFDLVEEADHHQSDATTIEALEDVYTGEADVVDRLGTGGGGGNVTCGADYEEFPIDDETSTCVWSSLVEWNCYAGSRHVSNPDLGGSNACLYYSLDFFQQDGSCRENYANVRFLGRDTCRWEELGADKAAWYTLEKEHGVESPQAQLGGTGGGVGADDDDSGTDETGDDSGTDETGDDSGTDETGDDSEGAESFDLPDGTSLDHPDRPNTPPAPDTSGIEPHSCSGERDDNDRMEGRWVCFYGNSVWFFTYEAGVKNGEFGEYVVSTGRVTRYGTHKDGKKEGVWWDFWSWGSTDFSTYEAGRLNGMSGTYNADGEPSGDWGAYEDGEKEGVWWRLDPSGWDYFWTYEAGRLNGESGAYNTVGARSGCWSTYTDGERGEGTYYENGVGTRTC